jgi:hypothetical protein
MNVQLDVEIRRFSLRKFDVRVGNSSSGEGGEPSSPGGGRIIERIIAKKKATIRSTSR